jgi:Fur family peroxide stress response transcriptional regulator
MDATGDEINAAAIDNLSHTLRKAGVRITSQRRKILGWIIGMNQGFTVNGAVDAMIPHGIGQATVYRTISIMKELGLLRQIRDPQYGSRLYCKIPGRHHAIICDGCGRVEEFDHCGWSLLKQLLNLQTGFEVHDHFLEVHGVCSQCRETR